MKKEYFIIVKGQVQGVSFRSLVQQRARACDLRGYVKNLEDQNVEICLQGDEKMVQKFLESLKQDSGFAKITELSSQSREQKKLFDSFSILR